MNQELLNRKFEEIGARIKFDDLSPDPWDRSNFKIDVTTDKKGQFFDLRVNPEADLELTVIASAPRNRHLLLMAKGELYDEFHAKGKFLCGHDERFWFVAAVPGSVPANVEAAKEALKPDAVKALQTRLNVKRSARNRRHNAAFVRQGEWFFIPAPDFEPPDNRLILRNEPISRGIQSKPHRVQFLFRHGGFDVYVSKEHPNALTFSEYCKFLRENPTRKLHFQSMRRDPAAFAKGRVTHPDHATIILPFWHKIEMNTESRAPAAHGAIAFLD